MDSLVSTEWLAAQPASFAPGQELAILDASSHLPMAGRDARAEFTRAHIPGAHFLALATLVDPESPVPAALPTAAQLAGRLAALGVADSSRFVLYDDSDVRTAARAWFLFRLHGHGEVAILDGGLGKWRAEGRPVEAGSPPLEPGTPGAFAALGERHMKVRSMAEMRDNLTSGAEQVVDAREAARFTGEQPDFRAGVAPGHIPRSLNLPFDAVLNEDGTYKDPATLRALFAEAGVDLKRPVVTTCGGGVTAAMLLFALHLAGKDDVSLYDGSWAEWGADPATPKALGPA